MNGNEVARPFATGLGTEVTAADTAAKLAAAGAKTMTVREVADALGYEKDYLRKIVKEVCPEAVRNGIETRLTEEQVVKIKAELTPRTLELKVQGQNAVTHTEMMQKAAEVMAWLTAENKRMSEKIALDAPKVETYDILADRSYLRGFRDAAGTLGIRQSEFMRLLKSKYIYQNGHGGYRAYAEYASLFSLRAYAKGDVKGDQLMLTVAGIDYFRKLING